jgi:cytidylate kinase
MGMHGTPRGIEALVDEQVRRWEHQRLSQMRRKKQVAPVIVVSRQFGGLGAALARVVAARLGFQLWDRDLLQAVAEHGHASAALIASLDERRRDAITDYIEVLGSSDAVTHADYLRALARVVRTIAEHGRAVIVGRGAQYMLEGHAMLRARAVASLEARVANLIKSRGLDEREAYDLAREVDAERTAFVRESFGRDIEDPTENDLLVNTGTLSLEQAASVVVAAYHARFPQVVDTADVAAPG